MVNFYTLIDFYGSQTSVPAVVDLIDHSEEILKINCAAGK